MLRQRSPLLRSSRCKHCRVKFGPDEKGPLHSGCVDGWYEANREKLAAKAKRKKELDAKAERAKDRAKKQEQKKLPQLIKEAQREFNAFIRARDQDQPCICCGRPLGTGDVGGAFDCGHYRSTGSAPHLRFDERNAHGQTKACNRYGAGRAVDYRIGLVARIGREAVEALESDNRIHRWTREELIGIRDTYRAKVRELKKARGL